MYISTQEELDAFLKEIAGTDILAIDTEFHREKTYYAKLCLLQVATDDLSAIIDPLSGIDLSALCGVLSDERVCKIFHAGTQDIELMVRCVGCAPHPIFDTQLAAGLLGHPQQLGYSALVKAYCEVSLEKSSSFTDWTARPLSPTQIEYAIDDVLYLPRIYRTMLAQLKELGRLHWLDLELEQMADPSNYTVDLDTCWRRVKRVGSLTKRQLAVVQAVAKWRELTAQTKDVPRKWVLSDEHICEIAKRTPANRARLLEVRGLSDRLSEQSIKEILDCIEKALAAPEETWPRYDHRQSLMPTDECLSDMLYAIVRLRARENEITPLLLASHDDMNSVIRGGKDLPVLHGWRLQLVGYDLLDFLEGKTMLACRDGSPVLEELGGDMSQP